MIPMYVSFVKLKMMDFLVRIDQILEHLEKNGEFSIASHHLWMCSPQVVQRPRAKDGDHC